MVTFASSSKPRLGDSVIEKIEVKLTHFFKKTLARHNSLQFPVAGSAAFTATQSWIRVCTQLRLIRFIRKYLVAQVA